MFFQPEIRNLLESWKEVLNKMVLAVKASCKAKKGFVFNVTLNNALGLVVKASLRYGTGKSICGYETIT